MKRFGWAMLMVLGLGVCTVLAEEKKNPADADGDGKVSKQEFMDREASKAQKDGKEFNAAAAEKKFAKTDKDGNGFLEGEELVKKPKTPHSPEVPPAPASEAPANE